MCKRVFSWVFINGQNRNKKRKISRKTKWKLNRKARKLFFEYMEYLSFAQTGPFCTSLPFPPPI